jgi:hypothetical protein
VTPATALQGACQWWIQTWNDAGYGPWSDGMNFTVGGPPGPATLISPSGSISTTAPTYTWNAVSSATWYYLWVNDSTTAAGKIKTWYTAAQAGCASGSGTCSVTPSTVLAQGACQWWIQTWNDAGYGPWSSGMSFYVSTPAGYWGLNGDLSDSIGRGNGGTLHFTSSTYNPFSAGKLNSALDCSGGAYAEIPSSASLSALGSMTIEAWIYLNHYPAAIPGSSVGGPIINKWGPDSTEDGEYLLNISPDGTVYAAFSGISFGQVGIRSSRLIPLRAWTHVAAVLDTTNHLVRLYVNGEIDASSFTNAVADRNTTVPVRIGYAWVDWWGGRTLDGMIDEVRIWNLARSQEQIQASMKNEPQ